MLNHKKEKTRLAIQNALSELLKTTTFDKITTLLIANTAGISRSGFYTHYRDKYEVIEQYQYDMMIKISSIFQKFDKKCEESFMEFFEFLKQETLLPQLITSSYISHAYIITKIKTLIIPKINSASLSDVEKEYTTIYLSHAFFGICQSWILNKYRESPKTMAKIVLKMLPIDKQQRR